MPTGSSGTSLPSARIISSKVKYRLLNGEDELNINKEIESRRKIGQSSEVTTRMKHAIVSIDGEDARGSINNYVDNMLSKDSLAFRQEMAKIAPDINLSQEVEMEGEMVRVDIPMTINFFWPSAG